MLVLIIALQHDRDNFPAHNPFTDSNMYDHLVVLLWTAHLLRDLQTEKHTRNLRVPISDGLLGRIFLASLWISASRSNNDLSQRCWCDIDVLVSHLLHLLFGE